MLMMPSYCMLMMTSYCMLMMPSYCMLMMASYHMLMMASYHMLMMLSYHMLMTPSYMPSYTCMLMHADDTQLPDAQLLHANGGQLQQHADDAQLRMLMIAPSYHMLMIQGRRNRPGRPGSCRTNITKPIVNTLFSPSSTLFRSIEFSTL